MRERSGYICAEIFLHYAKLQKNFKQMKYLLIVLLSALVSTAFSQEIKNWTIMHYSVGSNSSESYLLSDIAEMKRGKKSKDYNFILLIDRVEGFSEDSTTLDGNFTDTRLYQIEYNSYHRLDGKEFLPKIGSNRSDEANMAEALTLKKFIMIHLMLGQLDFYKD